MFLAGANMMAKLVETGKKIDNEKMSEKMSLITPEQALTAVIAHCGNKSAACRFLKVNIKTLNRALAKLNS